MSSTLCGICLDDNKNDILLIAPCGFQDVRFHKTCLDRYYMYLHGLPIRCPHCNQVLQNTEWIEEISALDNIKQIAKEWISLKGFWNRRPIYVRIQYGLQNEERENRTLYCVISNLVSELMLVVYNGLIRVLSFQQDPSLFKIIGFLDSGNEELVLTLRRVAYVKRGGVFEKDGYMLSGLKRRISPRLCFGRRYSPF